MWYLKFACRINKSSGRKIGYHYVSKFMSTECIKMTAWNLVGRLLVTVNNVVLWLLHHGTDSQEAQLSLSQRGRAIFVSGVSFISVINYTAY